MVTVIPVADAFIFIRDDHTPAAMVCPSSVVASKNHPCPVGVPIEPAAAHAPALPCAYISPQPVAVPTSTVMADPVVPPVPVTSWLAVESVLDAAKLFSRTVRAVTYSPR